jgi:membrane protein implicated in regulation of membrane protease activity
VLIVIAILLAIFFLPQPWGLLAVVVAGVVETAESLLFVWWSQRRRARVGVETLVGRTAVAVSALAPRGQVKIDGELWEARSDGLVESGTEVVVKDVEGLTLLVEGSSE